MPRRLTYRDLILAALTRKPQRQKELDDGHRQTATGHRGRRTGQRASVAAGTVGGTGQGGTGQGGAGGAGAAPGGTSPGLILKLPSGAVLTPAQVRSMFDLPEPEPLPVEKQADTIVAWKRADLAFDRSGRLRMVGPVYRTTPYDPAGDTAHHEHHPQHLPTLVACEEAPGEYCRCGFYGISSPAPSPQWGEYMSASACLTVQVELWGRVIEHEHGWRAQHQRVLGAWVDTACSATVPGEADIEVTSFGDASQRFLPVEMPVACQERAAAVAVLPGRRSGAPMCAAHASARVHSRFLFTPAELSSALAVECAWGPAPAARTLP